LFGIVVRRTKLKLNILGCLNGRKQYEETKAV